MNELTDELQISLEKLHETEVELKTLNKSESNSQLLPKSSGLCELDDSLKLDVSHDSVCVHVFNIRRVRTATKACFWSE